MTSRVSGSRAPKVLRDLFLMAALGLLPFFMGCLTGRRDSPFGSRGSRYVWMEVENHNFLDLTVYAVSGGSRVRLGAVSGKASGRFTIDPDRISINSGIRVGLDPVGSLRGYLSDLVFPAPGNLIVLTVGADIRLTHILIR